MTRAAHTLRRWTPVLALLLWACGSSEVPLPSIVAISPERMSTSENILLTIELDGPLPFKVDYGKSSAEVLTSALVGIANQELRVIRVEEAGRRVIAEVMPGLPVGPQDLRVVLEDGREAVLERGFEVTPPLDITDFRIDPIATQLRLRPFTIMIRAQGPDAALFRGRVKLSTSKGTITPSVSGPFNAGECLQEIIVDETGGANVAILVEDYAGHTGISNTFRLDPN
jgi:hypothetical protein